MSKVEFDCELKRLAACVLVAQNAKKRGDVKMMVDAIADCNAISKELAKHLADAGITTLRTQEKNGYTAIEAK